MLPDFLMDKQEPDKKLFVAAASTANLTVNNRHVFVAGASPVVTRVLLPNVSEAEHYRFCITCTTIPATTGALVRVVYNDGGLAALSTDINTTGVDVEFESNGIFWTLTRAV